MIKLSLEEDLLLDISLYDQYGKKITAVADRVFTYGMHTINLGEELPGGLYLLVATDQSGLSTTIRIVKL
jgi:hypothetical protein